MKNTNNCIEGYSIHTGEAINYRLQINWLHIYDANPTFETSLSLAIVQASELTSILKKPCLAVQPVIFLYYDTVPSLGESPWSNTKDTPILC